MIPNTRAELRKLFYRLVSTESDDDRLTDRGEAEDEIADYAIQYGLWAAQRHLIRLSSRRWVTNSAELAWTTGADGLSYLELPDDFIRLAGDERSSAITVTSTGRMFGRLIDPRDSRFAGSDAYWIENGRLTLGRNTSPPSGLSFPYHARLAEITDDDAELDFPEELLPMIPAEGAYIGMHEGWLVGGPELEAKIARNRAYWQNEASRTVKPTEEPQKLRVAPPRAPGIFI